MRKILITMAALAFCGGAVAELADGLYAAFDTSMGSFTCRLDYAEAPVTCANFAGLAEGSQHWIDPETGSIRSDPFYDDLIFHRVITNFMIQGGCPLGNGTSGPGYAFPDEFVPTTNHYENAGTLVMANSGPDSNGSQIFVTVVPYPNLDASKYMVFGNVIDGIGVVTNIGAAATTGPTGNPKDRPLVDVVMNQVRILRIGTDAENFDPLAQPLPEVTPRPLAITHTAELEVSTIGITNQCEVQIFNSANLSGWSNLGEKYFPVAVASWEQPASTNRSAEFFKAAQVYYPQAVTVFSNIEGHTLTFTNATESFVFSPATGGTGTCNIVGNPDTLVFWAEWTSKPYVGSVVFDPANFVPFQFTLSPNGICNGYWWNDVDWIYIGEFSFTDTPPAP